MKIAFRIVLICLFAASAWAQQVQVSANYLYQGSNQAPGATSWLVANGGRADVSVGNWRSLGLVAEFAGARMSSVNSSEQTTFTYMAGTRRSIALGHGERRNVSAFAQVLLGGVHASNGIFPSSSSADGFAFSTGGGLQAGLNHRISVRLLQVDYLYTRLPNFYENYQSNFRLGAGVAFHLK